MLHEHERFASLKGPQCRDRTQYSSRRFTEAHKTAMQQSLWARDDVKVDLYLIFDFHRAACHADWLDSKVGLLENRVTGISIPIPFDTRSHRFRNAMKR